MTGKPCESDENANGFRRRYLVIGGTGVALIGCIVAATAPNVPALIGGTVLIGLGASAQQQFSVILNELVAMKHRFYFMGCLYVFILPLTGFGPLISSALILRTKHTWRSIYYLLIGINAASGILHILFYFPPNFRQKHRIRTRSDVAKKFDYFGTFLFVAGFVLFELGFLWGGGVYPWKSARVLCTLLVGAATLAAFVVYELILKPTEPVLVAHIFKNLRWVAATCLLGLGASIYYTTAIVWPQQVAVLYATSSGQSIRSGLLNAIPQATFGLGSLVAGFTVNLIGHARWQCVVATGVCGALLASMAYSTPDTLAGSSTMMGLACFAIGWTECVCQTNAGIEIEDQQEIGTAVGTAASLRSAISTVAASVFIVVLTNRLTQAIPKEVPAALTGAGLDPSAVPSFLAGLTSGDLSNVPGLTPAITAVGVHAYKVASSHAYRTVYLTSLAFTGVALICACFTPNIEKRMTSDVAAVLRDGQFATKDEEINRGKEGK